MMEIMRCNLCGKLAMILQDGGRRTICCDQLMEKLEEQSDGPGKEMHVPVIEKKKRGGISVKIGNVPHPMLENNHVRWIEVQDGKKLQVAGLSPGDQPEAGFAITGTDIKVRSYCDKHGLWTNKPGRGT